MVSLTEPSEDGHGVVGPGPGLRKYCQTQNLRVIGELQTNTYKTNVANLKQYLYFLKGNVYGRTLLRVRFLLPVVGRPPLSVEIYWQVFRVNCPIKVVIFCETFITLDLLCFDCLVTCGEGG